IPPWSGHLARGPSDVPAPPSPSPRLFPGPGHGSRRRSAPPTTDRNGLFLHVAAVCSLQVIVVLKRPCHLPRCTTDHQPCPVTYPSLLLLNVAIGEVSGM